MTVHEASHAWTANSLGDPTARVLGRLSLNPAVHVDLIGTIVFPLIALLTGVPLIGWAKPVPVDMRHLRRPKQDFAIVALAGPVSNVVMAAIGAILFKALALDDQGALLERSLLTDALFAFVFINVLLAVFNMIPIPPLDGGNVLIGILPDRLGAIVDRLRAWGFLLLYVLLLSGMLGAIVRPVYSGILRWLF